MLLELSDREHATVLAALRYWQGEILADQFGRFPPEIEDIASNGGTVQALDVGEIDTLCERINTIMLDAGP
jgi:hypothetical protein